MSAKELRSFTTDQLLEELVRRRNERQRRAPEHWCHDCEHFKPAPQLSDAALESYNPCTKKHRMALWLPHAHEDPHFGGFYRRVCADRQEA